MHSQMLITAFFVPSAEVSDTGVGIGTSLGSSTAFVHMRRYNQHKMKVLWRGLKYMIRVLVTSVGVLKNPSNKVTFCHMKS